MCLCICLTLFALFRSSFRFLIMQVKQEINTQINKKKGQQTTTKTIKNSNNFFLRLLEKNESLQYLLWQTRKIHRHLLYPCFTAIYFFLQSSFIFPQLSYMLKDSNTHSIYFVSIANPLFNI